MATLIGVVSLIITILSFFYFVIGFISPKKVATEQKGEVRQPSRYEIFKTSVLSIAIFGVVSIVALSSDDENGETTNGHKIAREYFEEYKSQGLIRNKEDSVSQWKKSLQMSRKDSLVKIAPNKQELDEILSATRDSVYNYFKNKKSIRIAEFPEKLSSREVERTGRVRRDSIIAEYKLSYKLWYRYDGSLKRTDVEVSMDHNTYNNTWRIKRLSMPDLNRFYADTPEGREEIEKALLRAFSRGVAEREPVWSTTADALYADYQDNEIRADSEYKGKIIEISGVVKSVGKDKNGYPYIFLRTSQTVILGIQCFLGEYNYDDAMRVSKGQRVRIKGKVAGKFTNIQLHYCQVVE